MVVHILCVSGIFVYLTSLLAYLCFSFLNIMVRHLSRIIFIHQTSDSCIQEKIYQHKVISHPVYKGLQFSIGARVYYFIIKGLNSGKRCPVTVNVLGNLITPIKKKKKNLISQQPPGRGLTLCFQCITGLSLSWEGPKLPSGKAWRKR